VRVNVQPVKSPWKYPVFMVCLLYAQVCNHISSQAQDSCNLLKAVPPAFLGAPSTQPSTVPGKQQVLNTFLLLKEPLNSPAKRVDYCPLCQDEDAEVQSRPRKDQYQNSTGLHSSGYFPENRV
jgi:hypothetical protein